MGESMKSFAYLGALALASTLAMGSAAQAAIVSFDSAGDTAGWTVDRHAPATFTSGVTYGGRMGTLEVGISGADFQGNNFYNTQGRALDLGAGATALSIELYIDASYLNDTEVDPSYGAGSNVYQRIAGFWGVSPVVGGSAYPIIELDNVDGNLLFRGWDNAGGFFDLGAATVGTWQTLTMGIAGANYSYTAGGVTALTSNYGATSINSVILQGRNYGADYTAHWDNLTAGVPEPATWAMMILGMGFVGSVLRRRSQSAVAA